MQDINLLPNKVLYKKRYFFLRTGKILGFAVLVLGIAALLLTPTYQRIELQKQVLDLSSRLDVPELKELNDLENKLATLKKDYSNLEALTKSIPSRKVATDQLLLRITSQMPSGMTASDISYQAGIQQVSLQLTASHREDISLLLKRLHDDPLFSDINIGEINGMDTQYKFALLLKLK